MIHSSVATTAVLSASTAGFPWIAEIGSLAFGLLGLIMSFRVWRGMGNLAWVTDPKYRRWRNLYRGLLGETSFWLTLALLLPWLALATHVHKTDPIALRLGYVAIVVLLLILIVASFVVSQQLIFAGRPRRLVPPILRQQQ
jgi:hypothetical protein